MMDEGGMAVDDVGAVRVILMTAPDRETGEAVAGTLVEEGLAACATLLPGAFSIYRWEGKVERQAECQVILKAPVEGVPALLDRAASLHPYDVPELLVLPVTAGFPAYLRWVRGGT